MDLEQLTDAEWDAMWGATEEAADMEREKFRKACADLRKAIAEKAKPILNFIMKCFNGLIFWLGRRWRGAIAWIVQREEEVT